MGKEVEMKERGIIEAGCVPEVSSHLPFVERLKLTI